MNKGGEEMNVFYKIINKLQILATFIIIASLLIPTTVTATEPSAGWEPEYEISASPNSLRPGKKTTVTVSVKNYNGSEYGINGIQIDITGLDSNLLKIENIKSCISSTTAMTNKGVYTQANSRVRFLYFDMNNILDMDQTQLVQFDVTPISTATQEELNQISFNTRFLTTLVGTSNNKKTSNTSFVFGDEEGTDKVQTLDITFGDLKYEYREGFWNPLEHAYGEGSWSCNKDADKITISGSNVSIQLAYQNMDNDTVAGSFWDEEDKQTDIITFTEQDSKIVKLKLSGEPQGLGEEYSSIGSVTITVIPQ